MGRSRTRDIINRVERQAERSVEAALAGLKIAGQSISTATLSVDKRHSGKTRKPNTGKKG